MGTNSSSDSICPYCTKKIKLPPPPSPSSSDQKSNNDSNSRIFCCTRCHGALKFLSQKRMKFDMHPQPIQYLYVAPFKHNLDLEFKEYNDDNNDNKDMDDMDDMDDEMKEEMRKAIQMSLNINYDPSKHRKLHEILINDYIKPYFLNKNKKVNIRIGNRFIIRRIEFKIFGCYPPFGYINQNTQYYLNDCNNKLIKLQNRPIYRIHIKPTKVSLKKYPDCDQKQILNYLQAYLKGNDNNKYINNNNNINNSLYFNRRHLMENEIFLCKKLEFFVAKCEPCNGFIDLSKTQIFCDDAITNPIEDIKSISIRPIYDMLPNDDKTLTVDGIKSKYIKPYFYSSYRYLETKDNDDIVNISNVNFMIIESKPHNGIITCATKIINCLAIHNHEIQQIQSYNDQQYAQQIQQQLNHQMGAMGAQNILNFNNYNNINLQNRNPNDPFFQFIRLMEQLQYSRANGVNNNNNNAASNNNNGITQSLIDTLPTFKHDINKKTDNTSCRICLEEYKDGDVLRAVPCFHSFHQNCLDSWLQINAKCPICKSAVLK